VSEPKKFSQKLKVHFEDFWNITDTISIVLFVTGIVFRFIPYKSGYGKVSYHKRIGPVYNANYDLLTVPIIVKHQ
jgi:hypothetical protein